MISTKDDTMTAPTQADRLVEKIKRALAAYEIPAHVQSSVSAYLAALAKQQAAEPCIVCNALIVPRNATHYDEADLAAARVQGRLIAASLNVEQQDSLDDQAERQPSRALHPAWYSLTPSAPKEAGATGCEWDRCRSHGCDGVCIAQGATIAAQEKQ